MGSIFKYLLTHYGTHIKFVIGVLICWGMYLAGYAAGNAALEQTIYQLVQTEKQEEILISKRIVTKYVDRIEVITVHDKNSQHIIKVDVPDKFILSLGWVSGYNNSLAGTTLDPTSAANATPSGINAGDALSTIAENNTKCIENSEQLRELQAYITEANKVVVKSNNNK